MCFLPFLASQLPLPFFYPIEVEPEVTKPQTSQTTNLLTESLKNAQKKKKSIFDDSDDSESDSENDVYQDTTNESTTKVVINHDDDILKVDPTENSNDAKANVEIAEGKDGLISEGVFPKFLYSSWSIRHI